MSNDKADGLNRASSIETNPYKHSTSCLLYTSDAADEL